MQDYLIKATAGNGSIRAFIAKTTDIVNDAHSIHNTSITATSAFGRILTATSMMGSMLKGEDELITLTVRCEGPLKGIVATSDCTARVKGYVFNPTAELPPTSDGKIDVPNALGVGTLNIIKDIGLKDPYIGQVDLESGEIAEDLTFYFAKSEQIPTSVSLGVSFDTDGKVKSSGGFIIQLMPNADENIVEKLEKNILSVPHFTTFLDMGLTPEEILDAMLGEFGVNINEKLDIMYYCNCNKQRVEKALVCIGETELEKIIKEDKKAILHCHFCGNDYDFSEIELEQIMKNLKTT